jgi:hypothetical protein
MQKARGEILLAEYGNRSAKNLSPEQIDRVTELLRQQPDAMPISLGIKVDPPAAAVDSDDDIPDFNDPIPGQVAQVDGRTVDTQTGEVLADPALASDMDADLVVAMQEWLPGVPLPELIAKLQRMACRRFNAASYDLVTPAGRTILAQEIRARNFDTLKLAEIEEVASV